MAGLAAQGILVQLRQDEDEVAQLDALNQLNELLSISSEESLSIFPVEQLVPVLVRSAPVQPCCCCAFAPRTQSLHAREQPPTICPRHARCTC